MDNQNIIYDLVKNIKLDQDSMKEDVADIKSDVRTHSIALDRYNDLLDTHIDGVNTLKQLHLDNAKRIALLEEPAKLETAIQNHHKMVIKTTAKILGIITGIVGLIVTLQKLL